jgi:hypothetical protein
LRHPFRYQVSFKVLFLRHQGRRRVRTDQIFERYLQIPAEGW